MDDLPLAKGSISAPEADGQSDHEEGVRSKVRGDSKVTIEGRSSHLLLHPGEVGRLPADQGEGLLAQSVPPFWQGALVWGGSVQDTSGLWPDKQ